MVDGQPKPVSCSENMLPKILRTAVGSVIFLGGIACSIGWDPDFVIPVAFPLAGIGLLMLLVEYFRS